MKGCWSIILGLGILVGAFAQHDIDDDILFNNHALISNNAATDNIDHIWHHDGTADGAPGTWAFVSDSTYKGAGSSRLHAGHVFMTGASSINFFSGKVGIGIQTPTHDLELRKNVNRVIRAAIRNDSSDSSAEAGLMVLSNGVAGFDILSYGTGRTDSLSGFPRKNSVYLRTHGGSPADRLVIGTASSSPIHFITGNQHRVTLNSSGRMGIGTQNPTYELSVNGVIQA